jgi:hypothetical protein
MHLAGGEQRFNADSVGAVSALLNDQATKAVPRPS